VNAASIWAELAGVTYDPKRTDLEAIQDAAVDAAGYSAQPVQEQDLLTGDDDAERKETGRIAGLARKVWVGGIISAILVIGSLPMMTGLHIPFIPMWLHNFWLQAVLTAPVQFWCGKSFYVTVGKP